MHIFEAVNDDSIFHKFHNKVDEWRCFSSLLGRSAWVWGCSWRYLLNPTWFFVFPNYSIWSRKFNYSFRGVLNCGCFFFFYKPTQKSTVVYENDCYIILVVIYFSRHVGFDLYSRTLQCTLLWCKIRHTYKSETRRSVDKLVLWRVLRRQFRRKKNVYV